MPPLWVESLRKTTLLHPPYSGRGACATCLLRQAASDARVLCEALPFRPPASAECPRGCHPLCAPCSPLSAHTTFIGNLVSCLIIFLGREYFASKCGDHSFVCFAPCTKRGNVQKLLGFKGISKCWDCNGGRLTFHSC